MHPLLMLVVPAYLGVMTIAILGLAAAIVPAQIRRRRDRVAAAHAGDPVAAG